MSDQTTVQQPQPIWSREHGAYVMPVDFDPSITGQFAEIVDGYDQTAPPQPRPVYPQRRPQAAPAQQAQPDDKESVAQQLRSKLKGEPKAGAHFVDARHPAWLIPKGKLIERSVLALILTASAGYLAGIHHANEANANKAAVTSAVGNAQAPATGQ